MTKPPAPQGYRDIAAVLRREWTVAPWRAGDAAPTHQEVECRFRSSRVTVQRTMELLTHQGFLETRPKVGSFFARRPPHLHQYGIVFPGHPREIKSWEWTRLSVAYHAAAQQVNRRGPWHLCQYFDLNPESHGGAGYDRLMADIDAQQLAGLIFTYTPHELQSTPLLRAPPLPLVFHSVNLTPGSLRIGWDDTAFWQQAFEWLDARDRRRVAILGIDGVDPAIYEAELATRGRGGPKAWVQCGNPYSHRWMRHTLAVLLEPRNGLTPDALIIADDHLVEAALSALADLGVRIPQDLAVVAHWNHPLRYEASPAAHLLAVDVCEVLERSLQAIEALRAGTSVPTETLLAPRPLDLAANRRDGVQLAAAQQAMVRAARETSRSTLPRNARQPARSPQFTRSAKENMA